MAPIRLHGLLAFAFLLGAGTILAPGCGGDDVGVEGGTVGGACFDDFDCEYRCQRGGHFPGGTCTVPCRFHEDCPEGSWCVDRDGGICLLECFGHADCRPGYLCDDEDPRPGGRDVLVCIDD